MPPPPEFLDTRPADVGLADATDPYASFRIDDGRQVMLLLREVRDAGVPVALSAPSGAALSATIWSLDGDRRQLSLDIEPGDPSLQSLVDGNEATGVAYLESVKLQFDLDGLVLVRSAQATALQARLPRRLWRFQRRNAYRVRPIDNRTPSAQLRHPAIPDMLLTLRILDVSIGGCALLLPPEVPPLPVGATLHGVTLTLDSFTRFEATLRLQHATSLMGDSAGLRLGCELLRMPAEHERLLQRFIDQTQRRRRLLSLD